MKSYPLWNNNFKLEIQNIQIVTNNPTDTPQMKRIGKIITALYTVDKLDEDKEFEIDLEFRVCLNGDDICVPITILSGARFAIPLCNENVTLPGMTF